MIEAFTSDYFALLSAERVTSRTRHIEQSESFLYEYHKPDLITAQSA